MAQVADYVLQRLTEWGVESVYGYPGDGIDGLLGAFDRAKGELEFIQARHEEMAAFMACAHAEFTGEVGCCTATSGPGAVHLLDGLCDAKLDHQPAVAVVGRQERLGLGAHYRQEVDLERLFADVSEFCQMVVHPGRARHVIDRAFKTALTTRGGSPPSSSPTTFRRRTPNPRRRRSTVRCSPASAGAARASCPTRENCAGPPAS